MKYISAKGLIHRDLAARNVLLFENFIAKISDFGLCCSSNENLNRPSENIKLPIKWLSLEALLEKNFSEKSDVWAFGILMYEVFTCGQIPYENMKIDELIMFLQSGSRLEKEEGMPNEIYDIMLLCWQNDFRERPSFGELEVKIFELIEKTKSL